MFKIGDKVLYSPWLNCSESNKKIVTVESTPFVLCGSECIDVSTIGAVCTENLEPINKED